MKIILKYGIPGCVLLLDSIIVVMEYENLHSKIALFLPFFLISIVLQRIFHEAGHWFGGKMDGYGFIYFFLGPVLITRTPGGRIASKISDKSGMQCVMYPVVSANRKYFAYISGGIFANLVSVLVAGVCMLRFSGIVSLFLLQIFMAGMTEILLNMIPFCQDGHPNDGFTLWILCTSETALADYILYLRIYADYYFERDIDYKRFIYSRSKVNLKDEDLFFYNQLNKILKIATSENSL